MKRFVFILLLFPLALLAQQKIMVEGTPGNLYVNHSAAPKENFYSIGRLYNISPKEVAPYNKLTLENGLSIGQVIKIPLRPVNFLQSNSVGADEVAVPLYHNIVAKETLYQLAADYNNVPVASLKAWNNMKTDAVTPGQNIIVGYLRVKKDLSALAQGAVKIPQAKQVAETAKVAESKIEKPVVKKTATVIDVVPAEKPAVKEIAVAPSKPAEPTPLANNNIKEGTFKPLYSSTGKTESGAAGIFKSTSGWEDGKYYCLHNTAEQNTIVKITNPANGRYVYAKVLDVIPDLKQNKDLTILVSNAAVDALGADTNGFNCAVNF